ncbi:hypothetical protein BB561_004702 [Smittium simulii]|uniref:AN1-type domain-containing protein n=1 Tax=Smittium simulii TaxID=133385 RepID=A0A2T9YES8_9FUNG|nr:hypothetical protein BB561_004702 [Smittium simulii]
MELPDLGSHCADINCNRLGNESHWKTDQHGCSGAHKVLDVKVPVCPICGTVIPVNRGENPNYRIERHINMGCSKVAGTTSSKPAYNSNRCKFKDCQLKGLVFVNCSDCKQDFCLKHRHPTDHNCKKINSTSIGYNLNPFSKTTSTPKNKKLAPNTRRNSRKSSSGCILS